MILIRRNEYNFNVVLITIKKGCTVSTGAPKSVRCNFSKCLYTRHGKHYFILQHNGHVYASVQGREITSSEMDLTTVVHPILMQQNILETESCQRTFVIFMMIRYIRSIYSCYRGDNNNIGNNTTEP